MWEKLPNSQKAEYKKMISFFSSLTPLFSQKHTDKTVFTPYINSKFQEKIFQISFNATAEDLGNTSYDASVTLHGDDGITVRYLVGIKSFIYNEKGKTGGSQKVAQFKSNNQEWAELVASIQKCETKEKTNQINQFIYQKLAEKISTIRNERILSSEANLKGFTLNDADSKEKVETVYHVLMPSVADASNPVIYVGETIYTKIDLKNLKIIGCTSLNTPQNFEFEDGIHRYKYTPADCQLYMYFDEKEIIKDTWSISYVEDAYDFISKLANSSDLGFSNGVFPLPNSEHIAPKSRIIASFSWSLINSKNEVYRYSGFNNFNSPSSKLSKSTREKNLINLMSKYKNEEDLNYKTIYERLNSLLFKLKDTEEKEQERNLIINSLKEINNEVFSNDVKKMILRPALEMYIPVKSSKEFHTAHPDFFGKDFIKFDKDMNIIDKSVQSQKFYLYFEPSGKKILCHITQDNLKGIQSCVNQEILGKWILHDIFQLKEREVLTKEKLEQIGINGIRLFRTTQDDYVHLEFIYIDSDFPPSDLLK